MSKTTTKPTYWVVNWDSHYEPDGISEQILFHTEAEATEYANDRMAREDTAVMRETMVSVKRVTP